MTTVGRWSPNKVRARVLDGTWVSPEELGGMVLLTPTSIAYSGTSATVGANGSVTFSACSVLSLNGVFSADYDNYMVVIGSNNTQYNVLNGRLMSSGTPASGTDYTIQRLRARSTTIDGARTTSATSFVLATTSDVQWNGYTANIYGPFLAQPTAIRNTGVAVSSGTDTLIDDRASTHSLSNSYDGLYIFPATAGNEMTGLVSVFGLVGA